MSSLTPEDARPQCKVPTTTLASKLWMTMLGLSLCLMGMGGCTYLWLSFQKARATDHWAEVPATIIVSMIDDSRRTQHNDVKYQLELHYRYEFEGEKYLSSKAKMRPLASKIKKKIVKWQQRFPVGRKLNCYVNPEQAEVALLIKPSKAAIYSIWFPSLLVLFGLKMIFNIFSTKAAEKR